MVKDGQRVDSSKVVKAVEDFGGLIRDYRLAHRLSLQDMAEIVGYSASYLWRIEKYDRFPEMDTKLKMLLVMWSIEDVHKYLDEIVEKEKSII